jgi:hypothetical protein
MRWDHANNALRIALDLPANTLIGEHAARVAEIGSAYPHTIILNAGQSDLTCVPYALRLDKDATYRAIAVEFDREVFAGPKFVEWLLIDKLDEVQRPSLGSLALYFYEADWRHIGVVGSPGRITSKWGTFPVYDHNPPLTYGDHLRFYKKPSPEDAIALFLDYCRSEGICDQDITDIQAEVEKAP